MRIVNVDSKIVEELRSSGISQEMRSLESMDWLVLADMNEEIVGAAGVGGLFNVEMVQTRKDYQGKGVGGLVQASAVEEAKKEADELMIKKVTMYENKLAKYGKEKK